MGSRSPGATQTTRKLIVLFGLGGFTLILDLLSKAVVSKALTLGQSFDVLDGILRITYIHNKGAIFGLSVGESTGSIVLVVSFLAAILIAFYYLRLPIDLKWQGVGLVLILSGAVGNLYDRILFGEVRDFIDIGINKLRWPIFNVADLAVTAGALLLAMKLTRRSKSQKRNDLRAD
ncbi:MAG: signal peptidase II [Candidatus Glassbacteria bacterium]